MWWMGLKCTIRELQNLQTYTNLQTWSTTKADNRMQFTRWQMQPNGHWVHYKCVPSRAFNCVSKLTGVMAWEGNAQRPFTTHFWRKYTTQANYSHKTSVVEVITVMEIVVYLSDEAYASTQKPSNIYMAATHLMAVYIISNMVSEETLQRNSWWEGQVWLWLPAAASWPSPHLALKPRWISMTAEEDGSTERCW